MDGDDNETNNEKIKNHIMLVVPICLENEEIKERDGDELIFMD